MAKLLLQRLPDPSKDYDSRNLYELIRVLESLIQQLKNKSEAEAWYFSR
jgi:hypothetical protein